MISLAHRPPPPNLHAPCQHGSREHRNSTHPPTLPKLSVGWNVGMTPYRMRTPEPSTARYQGLDSRSVCHQSQPPPISATDATRNRNVLKTIFPAVHLKGSADAGWDASVSGAGTDAAARRLDISQGWLRPTPERLYARGVAGPRPRVWSGYAPHRWHSHVTVAEPLPHREYTSAD